jgi:pilus assembly protein CpaF
MNNPVPGSPQQPLKPTNSTGHIIAVIGGKGGVGKSVFSVNLALAMAMDSKNGPALVDFDVGSTGDTALILGLKPPISYGDTWLDAKVKDSNDLKKIMKSIAVGPNVPPLFFLQAAQNQERLLKEEGDRIENALKILKRTFPVSIVDCGSRIEGGVEKVIDLASLILVVSNPEILVLNQTRKIIDKLQTSVVPNEIVKIVLNKVGAGNPYTPQFIEQSLKRQVLAQIPDDPATAFQSLTKGAPIVVAAPQSALAKSIFSLSRLIIDKRILDAGSQIQRAPKPQIPSTGSSDPSAAKAGESPVAGKVGKDPKDARSLFKVRVHGVLVEKMDLKADQLEKNVSAARKQEMRDKATRILTEVLSNEDHQWKARPDTQALIKEILDETFGLGPLEDLLSDDTVTEIMVNRADRIYIEKSGKAMRSPVTFSSNSQLKTVIERIVSPIGRVINESQPYVDARLPDGSRVHAIIPPLAIDGPMVTIRKFPKRRLGPEDLIKFGTMTPEMADFLRMAIEVRANVLISGGTGSGKTTLLNVMSNFIPANERILTVEDAAELQLGQDHVGRLETRPAGVEGNNAVTIRDLVKQTLRMRPDRIIIGEVRGGEALDMLQAMNTGHDGSMATVHANTPRDALARLETLVMMSGIDLPIKAIREQIAGAVNLVVQQSRLSDGSRKVTYITEIGGMQGDIITTTNIFEFRQISLDANRKIVGKHMATGFIPKLMEKIEAAGLKPPKGLFKAA